MKDRKAPSGPSDGSPREDVQTDRLSVAGQAPVRRAKVPLAELKRWIAFRESEARRWEYVYKTAEVDSSSGVAYWAGYLAALVDLKTTLRWKPREEARAANDELCGGGPEGGSDAR